MFPRQKITELKRQKHAEFSGHYPRLNIYNIFVSMYFTGRDPNFLRKAVPKCCTEL